MPETPPPPLSRDEESSLGKELAKELKELAPESNCVSPEPAILAKASEKPAGIAQGESTSGKHPSEGRSSVAVPMSAKSFNLKNKGLHKL